MNKKSGTRAPAIRQKRQEEPCKLHGIPDTGKHTSSLILTLSHCPLASFLAPVLLLQMESYLTSRTSGRVEWSRMIREERFCEGMMGSYPEEGLKHGDVGLLPPAQGTSVG